MIGNRLFWSPKNVNTIRESIMKKLKKIAFAAISFEIIHEIRTILRIYSYFSSTVLNLIGSVYYRGLYVVLIGHRRIKMEHEKYKPRSFLVKKKLVYLYNRLFVD